MGYYERGTHRFVSAAACRLVAQPLLAAAQAIEEEVNRREVSPGFLTRVMLRWGAASGEIMVVPVVTGRPERRSLHPWRPKIRQWCPLFKMLLPTRK